MRHLVSIANLCRDELDLLLQPPSPNHGDPAPVALIFHEPSTRTRFSFDIAARRAGLVPLHYDASTSSEKKGETILDTCRNLAWMGVRAIVLRTPQNGLPAELATQIPISVINAGDGTNEHPTQALADALTLREHFGRIEGLTVTIMGDIEHSRVARSLAHILKAFGARVHLVSGCCPVDIPRDFASPSPAEGLDGADVVYVLRPQTERHDRRDIIFGVDLRKDWWAPLSEQQVAKYAQPHTVVMHPGPVNRGVEVVSDLIDGPRSLVAKQVANGVLVRTRLLQMIART